MLLPITEQERYRSEWGAEVAFARESAGSLAALRLALRLLQAAPRMTMQMRANSESGYAELSVGLIFSVIPSSVLTALAVQSRVWIMVLGELALIAGVLLMVSGFWSFEGRLFDSGRSRVGLALALVGSAIEIVVRRTTGFGPPIDAVVSADVPHALILLGLTLWVASTYAGRLRFRILWLAVAVMAPGAALNMIVVTINGFSLTGFDRFGVLMYVVPSAGLAWACYSIVGRRQVFASKSTENSSFIEA